MSTHYHTLVSQQMALLNSVRECIRQSYINLPVDTNIRHVVVNRVLLYNQSSLQCRCQFILCTVDIIGWSPPILRVPAVQYPGIIRISSWWLTDLYRVFISTKTHAHVLQHTKHRSCIAMSLKQLIKFTWESLTYFTFAVWRIVLTYKNISDILINIESRRR